MKLAARLLVLISLAATATLTFAQTYSTQIKNVIVVIQENRTPDNLFQDQNLINAGADISQSGLCGTTIFHDQQPLGHRKLQDCASPDHSHQPSWLGSYDGNLMDGPAPSRCPTGLIAPSLPVPQGTRRAKRIAQCMPTPPARSSRLIGK